MTEIDHVKKLIDMKESLVRNLAGRGDRSATIAICVQIAGMREYLRILEEQERAEVAA